MKLLPYRKVTLISKLSISEVSEIFQKNTSPEDFFIRNNDKLFSGTVYQNTFSIRLNLNYRNSFNPKILGKLIQQEDATKIELTFRPFITVTIFMIFWCSAILYAFCIVISEMIVSGKWEGSVFLPFGMLAITVVMFYGFFFEEYKESKDKIIKLLRSEQNKKTKNHSNFCPTSS